MTLPLQLALFSLLAASARATFAKTAVAVLHEDDGVYGSVVFHQYSASSPLFISALLRDVRVRSAGGADWAVHAEPVHYGLHARGALCGAASLRGVLRAGGRAVGALGDKHGRMRAPRFAQDVHDWDLTLFGGGGGARDVVNRSLVVRAGDVDACATIVETRVHRVRPGGVPCERVRYADCLVATGRDGACVLRACEGWRRKWGVITEETRWCGRKWERFPKRDGGGREGVVPCVMGRHSLLRPIEEGRKEGRKEGADGVV